MRKRVKPPENAELRPIGARALKSAGDTLRPYLPGARVLDLFAGQGRFGKMALDEGAEWVTFVEKDAATARALRSGLPAHAEVISQDVATFAAGGKHYDIVFADPPFPLWQPGFQQQLGSSVMQWLSDESIFLVKGPSRVILSAAFPALSFWKETRFGESTLSYFRYGSRGDDKNREIP